MWEELWDHIYVHQEKSWNHLMRSAMNRGGRGQCTLCGYVVSVLWTLGRWGKSPHCSMVSNMLFAFLFQCLWVISFGKILSNLGSFSVTCSYVPGLKVMSYFKRKQIAVKMRTLLDQCLPKDQLTIASQQSLKKGPSEWKRNWPKETM